MKLKESDFKTSNYDTEFIYRDNFGNYIETNNIDIANYLIDYWAYIWKTQFSQDSQGLTVESKKLYKTKDVWILCIEFEDTYIEIVDIDKLKEVALWC